LPNVIAGRIANVFNLRGTSFSVDAACASSLLALACALDSLWLGRCDIVLCVATDPMMAPSHYVKFSKIGALSADGSRPFDDKANGFVMGEGAGAVLLKPLSKAKKDGDKIYAVIRSVGLSSDGKGKGITAPNPEGQKLAVKNAFDGLEYGPKDIGLMEAHGTATKVGDAAEMAALNEIFKDVKTEIALGSVKSQIGHTKANAGMASLIKTALALHNKILPPSINFTEPSKNIDWQNSPFKVNTRARAWESNNLRRANVSAFGFGGTNAHATLEEYDANHNYGNEILTQETKQEKVTTPQTETEDKMNYQLLVEQEKLLGDMLIFSAPTREELFDLLNKISREISDDKFYLVKNAYQNHIAPRAEFAVSINAEDTQKLKTKIAYFLKIAAGSNVWEEQSLYLKMKGIYPFHPTTQKPKVCFMFPGQGAQYVDMMKDLASKYKIVRDTFEEADNISMKLAGVSLTEVIWSKPSEDKEKLKEREEGIKRTEITQPAILTANVAMMRLLYQFGIKPDVTMGHSLGEYGAAVAAGILSFEDALKAVTMRGSAMAGLETKDNGKMAAVAASADKVEPELKKISGYVAVANKNCPTQTVIAGESKSVDDAVNMFNNMGMQAVVIPVSHAFHSAIVRPAAEGYRKFLDTLTFHAPVLPITSNVSADFYPQDIQAIKDTMVEQIMSSVEWIKQVELAYQRGVRLFIEVGPKRILSAFVTNTLEGKKDIRVLASNHPKRGGITEFNDLMANLAAAGIEVDWSKTDLEKQETLYNPAFVDTVMPRKAQTVTVPVKTNVNAGNIVLENINCSLNLTKDQAAALLKTLQEKLGVVAVKQETPKQEETKNETPTEVKPEPKPEIKPLDEATVTKEVVTLISQKTGYPEDMLELDVDMEAELGIDTVKQAEMLVLLQEKYGITSNSGLVLKDYPTIRHCIKYIMSNTSKENNSSEQEKETPSAKEEDPLPKQEEKPQLNEPKQEEPEQEGKTQEEQKSVEEEKFTEQQAQEVIESAKETEQETKPEIKQDAKQENTKHRFLPVLVDAPISEEAKRNLSPKRTVLIFSDNAALTKAYNDAFKMEGLKTHIFTKLKTRGKNVSMTSWESLQETQTAFETFIKENQYPVQGIVYLLPCSLKKYDKRQNPATEADEYLRPLKLALKIFEKDLKDKSNADTFLVTVFENESGIPFVSQENPTNGTVLGATLSLRKELYDNLGVLSKIIAFDRTTSAEVMAQKTIYEILKGDGRCLVNYNADGRHTVFYMPYKFAEGESLSLEDKTLAFTGKTGFNFALKVAEKFKTRLILIGEEELLDKTSYYATLTPAELKEEKIKLTEQLKEQDANISEETLSANLARIDDSITVFKNLQKLETLGCEAEYFNTDFANTAKLKETISRIRNRFGRVDGLFHLADLSKKDFGYHINAVSNFLAFNFVKDGGTYLFNTNISSKFGLVNQSQKAAADSYLTQLAYTLNALGFKAVNIATPIFEGTLLKKENAEILPKEICLELILEEVLYGKTPEVLISDSLGNLDWDKQLRFDYEEQTEIIREIKEETKPQEKTEPQQEEKEIEQEEVKEETTKPKVKIKATETVPPLEQENLFEEKPPEVKAETENKAEDKTEEAVEEKSEETLTGNNNEDYPFAGTIKEKTESNILMEKTFTADKPYLQDYSIDKVPFLAGTFGLECLSELDKNFTGQIPLGFERVHFYLPIKLLRQKPITVRLKAAKEADKINFEIESDFINSKGIKMGNTRCHITAENLKDFESS
ncbi:MAG: acyltransferase domain-containing protein, partial [Elusimicrobiaceae bacterium]|nr:acyltransferase domain-containing protein [Elusimicrobiaceae bacterium]